MLGLKTLAKKMFGTANDRFLKKLQPKVDAINALEADMQALSDEALKAKTQEFRDRLEAGETLDDILVEAFATVREAAVREMGMRHYDVQLIGGMVLNDCSIAEMKTGEGKTLVATLAAYLNALPGKGCHVVTVNDYLASRDAEWMGRLYGFLGLTTGTIVAGLDEDARRAAYACDITYGTNNEFGFDYLRDNMKQRVEDMVQREFAFAIVDEVDSILVDEARTPLIISGPTEDKSELYITINEVVKDLGEDDYENDEKRNSVTLTEEGTERLEGILGEKGFLQSDHLYDYENTAVVHHVEQALKANVSFERDKDYIVKGGKVIIIDEFTGRMMEGRRYSGGLHQALEAKENVEIQAENQTLASITFQNYFRMFPKLAGMTGTAATEAEEFADIYGLGVVEIPTHVPIARKDENDEFYRTSDEKYNAMLEEIRKCQETGQPALVGTVSIEKSEYLSSLLKKAKIKHQVLNARYHEQEAYIVAQAGRLGAVTIATNMAGRGTDIQLGGNADMRIEAELMDVEDTTAREKGAAKIREEVAAEKEKVKEAGGLYIIATERHESRRIDNQLRGRAGRQGDPGRTKFFLSLQDDLMRIFGPERMDAMLLRLGIEEGEAIVHPWINKAIEKAQGKVEARNFDIRKSLVKFDDVMNDQRKVIYEQRREIMAAEDISDEIKDMRLEVIEHIVAKAIPPKSYPDEWDLDGLTEEAAKNLGMMLPVKEWAAEEGVDEEGLVSRIEEAADKHIASKAANVGPDYWRQVEKSFLLQVIDQEWKDHLANLDHMRQSVGLRAYGQRDPLNEYKTEAFGLFENMLYHFRESVTRILSLIQFEAAPEELIPEPQEQEMQEVHSNPLTGENEMAGGSHWGNVPRNAPCPCGSGKKFKHCHGHADLPEGGAIDPNDPSSWGKISRNEPCPCGSGKKYKHCHGAV